ncbi:MAG TPA: dihydrofolate reductase family protein [Amnibacterium sp.]|jgi:dihydrofolate reductase
MGRVIVIQFITVDGVIEDPAGADGTAFGGWAMRHGPEAIAGDKFRLGEILTTGRLLFGRRTWDLFSTMWPKRSDPFSQAMNAAEKWVVTHREVDPAVWNDSHVVPGPVTAWARSAVQERDLVVIGSTSVVDDLTSEGLVDEYRLLTFPTAVGTGRRLFEGPAALTLLSTEQVGPSTLSIFAAHP